MATQDEAMEQAAEGTSVWAELVKVRNMQKALLECYEGLEKRISVLERRQDPEEYTRKERSE